ncbi:hypothetical protein AC1031_011017 [Aphanomyces cochlioides]|nr:hypothetical protein AC1031_011017 [Aphanomyces cochlioides]
MRIKRRKSMDIWATLLRLTPSGLNLAKLAASHEDATPHLLVLAGALAMHCHCGITFVCTKQANDSNSTAAILLLTDLVENGFDMRAQFHKASEKLSKSSAIVGFASVCGKEEIPEEDLTLGVPWFCGWTPKGAKLQVATSVRQLESFGLRHCTTTYEGNRVGEDRSDHWLDGPSAMYAIYDGHGGDIAVNFVNETLGRMIQKQLPAHGSGKRKLEPPNVQEILRQSFLDCDQMLKDKLTAYGPTVMASRGYCNTGSCAVVALFHGNRLYVANVGDCQAVLGHEIAKTPMHGLNYILEARVLTTLHDCKNPDEVKRVIERSNDRHAIRLSNDDQHNLSEFGAKRVAGSLMVTRAFGDWYLKAEEFSSMPYKSKVPYITAEPDVMVHELSQDDKFIILASDGLWEVISPDLAVQVVANYVSTAQHVSDHPIPSASAALVHMALEEAARREGMAMHELLALSKGPTRRSIHDDITCTVVFLEHP